MYRSNRLLTYRHEVVADGLGLLGGGVDGGGGGGAGGLRGQGVGVRHVRVVQQARQVAVARVVVALKSVALL